MAPKQEKDDSKDKGTRRILKKGLFAKDLAPMMYGFGDDQPAADTVGMMEELLIDHITEVCAQAQLVSTNRGKIKVEDFKFALRNDPKKLSRVEELLFMQEVISRARGKDELAQYAEEEGAIVGGQAGGTGVGGGGGGGGGVGPASKKAPAPAPVEPKGKSKTKAKKS